MHVQNIDKMKKTTQELQKIATLQICHVFIDNGQIVKFDFFCPECYLKFGVLSNHDVVLKTTETTFKCPLNKCRAVYSVKVASFLQTKHSLKVSKLNVSKICVYGTIN